MGDPAGIGGELTLKAWQLCRADDRSFYAIDDPERLQTIAGNLRIECPIEVISDPSQADIVFQRALPVIEHQLSCSQAPGKPEPANAASVIGSIKRAVADARAGKAAGVVTNPINKQALYEGADFAFPGHTEFLGHLGGVERTVMMLASPMLRVVPVTIHIPLREACDHLSTELIVTTAKILNADLKKYFGLERPRIAVSGLNPHAGEGGAMGREELEVIEPAIKVLNDLEISATGPWPADTMFHKEAREGYDVALCMYHDQALIPLKALDFTRGVNVTLGLPFIRTSPDHGTAYNIAGLGNADARSLVEAIKVASKMATYHA